jgi:hypothetical protein
MTTENINNSFNQDKKSFIELPADVILSQRGEATLYQRQIPLREIRTHYLKKGYGFHWEHYDAKMLQQLVTNRFIKEMIISRFEFTSKRAEIRDLTKIIIYGILYEEINKEISSIFLGSQFIETINSENPLKQIGTNTSFDKQKLADFINNNREAIDEFKKIISIDPFAVIDNDKSLDEKTRTIRKLNIKNIIENIDAKNWFLFYFIIRTEDKISILQDLNNLLFEYLKKIKIADYTSLVILELLSNLEKVNLLFLYTKETGEGLAKANSYILDTLSRMELLKSIEKHGLEIILNYKLSFHLNTERYILTVTIINKTTPFEYKAKLNASVAAKNNSEDNLVYYLNIIPEEELSSATSLFYLKSMIEVCERINLKFNAKVVFDEIRNETIYHLVLHL